MRIKATIKIPRCWKRLIEESFRRRADDALYVEDTCRIVGRASRWGWRRWDDPLAYYNDSRTASCEATDGALITVKLCSGQNNYFGQYAIFQTILPSLKKIVGKELVFEGEPRFALSDQEEFCVNNGTIYVVTIEWEGKDPYE